MSSSHLTTKKMKSFEKTFVHFVKHHFVDNTEMFGIRSLNK